MAEAGDRVYGASGYTGRLICEYLRELHVPFKAVGRDLERTQDVVDHVPGVDTIDHEVVEVHPRRREAQRGCSRARSVVCNTVGPFISYGHEVAEACLNVGAHYLDTTGEQDWVLEAQARWGEKFAEAGLLLSPGVAQMYTTGEIAANLALETPGMETLDILVLWKGFPTYASTQTIFTILKADWFHLVNNEYVAWDHTATRECVVPGQHGTALTVPWGGTCHPVWFKNDPRVSTVTVTGGVLDRAVMDGVVATTQMFEEQIRPLAPAEQEAKLAEIAGSPAGGDAAAREPAREHLRRLGLRVGSARPRARRHPRQLQLQADRPAPGLRRRTRCCSSRRSASGWRPRARRSGTASCSASCAPTAWCSTRHHRPRLTRCPRSSTTWTRARRSAATRPAWSRATAR